MSEKIPIKVYLTDNVTSFGVVQYLAVKLQIAHGEFDQLEIEAVSSNREERSPYYSYGWDVNYNCYRVDLWTAERMVKALRKINRKLNKWAEDWGYPQTFAEYAQRVLKVVKPDEIHCRIVGDPMEGARIEAKEIKDVINRRFYKFNKSVIAAKQLAS